MKNLSNNELNELICLVSEINKKISDYCHVSDKLPKVITNEIDKYKEKLLKEYDKRENDY